MNIDFKMELLRFLVPPSLFWSILILSSNINQSISINQFFTCNNILLQSTWWIFSFIFISTGLIISAIGAFIIYWVDEWQKPVWQTAKKEITHWEKISAKGESGYFSKKIEAKWHFYYLNLNSVLALLGALVVIIYEHWGNCELIIFNVISVGIIMMLIFGSLAKINYQRVKEI